MKLTYDQIAALVAANNKSNQDDALIIALCYKESGFDPNALTKDPASTAAGLMGVTETAIREVNRVDNTRLSYQQVYISGTNIEMGSRYLRIMIRRFGSTPDGLDKYGTGPGYSRNVLAAAAALPKSGDGMDVLLQQIGRR